MRKCLSDKEVTALFSTVSKIRVCLITPTPTHSHAKGGESSRSNRRNCGRSLNFRVHYSPCPPVYTYYTLSDCLPPTSTSSQPSSAAAPFLSPAPNVSIHGIPYLNCHGYVLCLCDVIKFKNSLRWH